ncbi:d-beta-d-heptose 1-phosphate adenosyltransferase [Lasius niger]|uniref:D-beta-d-heptose 1-phosphate adenosyltransferase n=1 Tax=Lasius niger TaxID=67767 RepID=A0A0J7KTH0_LASNI|nr:d-beta-d-heptose 1-phosphate adenosyltransferase [Lasius niger]
MGFLGKKYGQILIIGDVMLDQYVLGQVDRISPEAPVPVILEKNLYAVPGGAANVAANAAALGACVKLVGLSGEDDAGRKLKSLLKALFFSENDLSPEALAAGAGQVDISGLVSWEGRPTTVKTRLVSGNQQIARLDREEVGPFPESICQKIIESAEKAVEWADIIVFSDYKKGCLEGEIFQKISALAVKSNKKILVDPKQADLSFYKGASLLTPNKAELLKATHLPLQTEDEIKAALSVAAEKSGAEILLTRSADGMSFRQKNGKVTHFPAHRVEVADVSGAGDTVLATLAVMLARNFEIKEAIKIAIEAAALAVSRHGTVQITLQALREKQQIISDEKESLQPFAPIFEKAHDAMRFCSMLRKKKKRLIFTNGCFDILHLGHLRLLQKAAALGDYLIVGINTDSSVKKLKGETRPLQTQEVRAANLAALKWVDMVVLFDEETPAALLKELQPDVIVKGGDYRPQDVVGGKEAEVLIFPTEAGYSTTSFIQDLLKKHKTP